MPTLNVYQLTDDPLNFVGRQILAALRGVQDNATPALNILQSAEFGIDSTLWDVMYGGGESPEYMFPMVRLFYGQPRRETDDGYGAVYKTSVPCHFYFLYYVGVPSGDPVRSSFVELRENHIRTCMESLRMDYAVPITDATGGDVWRWTTADWTEDHDAPFQYLDSSVQLTYRSGYACTRVDWEFWCKGVTKAPVS